MVVTFLPVLLISNSEAYNVVVLPAPVGPAQMTMPNGDRIICENASCVSRGIPSSPRPIIERRLSSKRITSFSPKTVDTVATRTSTSRPSTTVENCPSCGRRRSTMFMPAMIFRRLTRPRCIASGKRCASTRLPSMR